MREEKLSGRHEIPHRGQILSVHSGHEDGYSLAPGKDLTRCSAGEDGRPGVLGGSVDDDPVRAFRSFDIDSAPAKVEEFRQIIDATDTDLKPV